MGTTHSHSYSLTTLVLTMGKVTPLLPYYGEADAGATESETQCMCRNSKRENREWEGAANQILLVVLWWVGSTQRIQ